MKSYQLVRNKFRFVALISILVLVGFVATNLSSYFVAHNNIAKQVTESALPLTSDNVYSEIQRDLMQPIFIASLMAQDTFVRQWLISGEDPADKIIQYLAGIQQEYNTISAFFVSNNSLKYYHSTGILKKIKQDEPLDAWYFRVTNMTNDYEINLDYDSAEPSRLVVFINYRVYDFEHNFIGATGVGLALTKVKALIESYQRKFNRKIYFANSQGKITLRGDKYQTSAALLHNDAYQKLFNSDQPILQTSFDYFDGESEVHVNARYIPEFDWYVVIEQSDARLMDELFNTLMLNLSLSLVVTLVVIGSSYFLISGFQQKLAYMATVDKLSGAYNRHGFDILFKQNIRSAKRKQKPLTAILLDIDHFKKVNDLHGHIAGDNVIKQVAEVVRKQLRESDALCRWGGEEFLILLPECELEAAVAIAEKIRLTLFESEFLEGEHLSASFGIGQHQTEESETQWVHRLDMALYKAKNNGRNQVVIADYDTQSTT